MLRRMLQCQSIIDHGLNEIQVKIPILPRNVQIAMILQIAKYVQLMRTVPCD